MRPAHHARYGHRLDGLIVLLWRAGLRIKEALSLTETDLDERRGSILLRTKRMIAGVRFAWTRGVVGVAAPAALSAAPASALAACWWVPVEVAPVIVTLAGTGRPLARGTRRRLSRGP